MSKNAPNSKLLSDQVSLNEIAVVRRELEAILGQNIAGDIVEFGCYIGTTSVFLARDLDRTKRQLWLYDSFEGLPEKNEIDRSALGVDFKPGELHATRKQLERNLQRARPYDTRINIKKAWFSDLSMADIPDEIALAFLDGDYYRSILDPLEIIWPHLSDGATVIVDDYQNNALPGARRAIDEWLIKHPRPLRIEDSLAIFRK